MASKYLGLVGSIKKFIEGLVVSTGAPDAGKIPALDSTGRLDTTMMPVGIGADTISIECSEDLQAGNYVNQWNDGGTCKVRKADATAYGKKADGFVVSAFTSGDTALVYFENVNDQLSGMTPATVQYLSETAGQVTETAPTTADSIIQVLGKSSSATAMSVEIDSDPCENASA